MRNVYWLAFSSILWATKLTKGQEELGDIDLGCPQGCYLHGNFCYKASSMRATYYDAQRICKTGGGLLVQIMDMDTQVFLNKLYIRKYIQSYWFGLSDKLKEGEWLHTDYTRISGFQKWHPGEPNNQRSQQHCAHLWMTRDLEWDDNLCYLKRLFICEYTGDSHKTHFPSFDYTYYELSQILASHDDAATICKNKGGMLAMIKTEAIYNFLKKLIYAERFWLNFNEETIQNILQEEKKNSSWMESVWIGIRFFKGAWKQSDGTSVMFRNWPNEQPRLNYNAEACVKLVPFWSQAKCDEMNAFICQYPVAVPKCEPAKVNCIPENTSLTTDVKSNENKIHLDSSNINFTSNMTETSLSSLATDKASNESIPHPDSLAINSTSNHSETHLNTVAIHVASNMSEIRLGVAEFVIVLIACVITGMAITPLVYITMVKLRKRNSSTEPVRYDRHLDILSEQAAKENIYS